MKNTLRNCRECAFYTNSAQMHDDPFTCSGPLTEYCEYESSPRIIHDTLTKVDDGCKFKLVEGIKV